MTVKRLLAAFALLTAPAAACANDASAQPGSDTSTASVNLPVRTPQAQRKIERIRPGYPLKPRVIEAPGAAVMMIPASFDFEAGPFGPL